jgi:hypothetical protein
MYVIWMVYAVIAVTVFFLNVPNWLHQYYDAVLPWYWVVALVILSLPLLFRQALTSDNRSCCGVMGICA